MKQKNSYITFWLAKLPLLLLYVSFFTVQLFYNFEIANHAANSHYAAHKSQVQKSSSPAVSKANSPTEKKTVFRLNKRYQPQAVITCNGINIKPVVCYVSSKVHIHYSSGFIPSLLPPTYALRGPPAVV